MEKKWGTISAIVDRWRYQFPVLSARINCNRKYHSDVIIPELQQLWWFFLLLVILQKFFFHCFKLLSEFVECFNELFFVSHGILYFFHDFYQIIFAESWWIISLLVPCGKCVPLQAKQGLHGQLVNLDTPILHFAFDDWGYSSTFTHTILNEK